MMVGKLAHRAIRHRRCILHLFQRHTTYLQIVTRSPSRHGVPVVVVVVVDLVLEPVVLEVVEDMPLL